MFKIGKLFHLTHVVNDLRTQHSTDKGEEL